MLIVSSFSNLFGICIWSFWSVHPFTDPPVSPVSLGPTGPYWALARALGRQAGPIHPRAATSLRCRQSRPRPLNWAKRATAMPWVGDLGDMVGPWMSMVHGKCTTWQLNWDVMVPWSTTITLMSHWCHNDLALVMFGVVKDHFSMFSHCRIPLVWGRLEGI